MTERATPRRVVVTSPRTRAARSPGRWQVAREIDAQSPVGEVYMRSLVRTQLRLGLRVCAVLAVVLGGLPLLFTLAPGLRRVHLLGVPLPWVVLGVLVYPTLGLLAWLYVRAAERNERDFLELVERS